MKTTTAISMSGTASHQGTPTGTAAAGQTHTGQATTLQAAVLHLFVAAARTLTHTGQATAAQLGPSPTGLRRRQPEPRTKPARPGPARPQERSAPTHYLVVAAVRTQAQTGPAPKTARTNPHSVVAAA